MSCTSSSSTAAAATTTKQQYQQQTINNDIDSQWLQDLPVPYTKAVPTGLVVTQMRFGFASRRKQVRWLVVGRIVLSGYPDLKNKYD